MAAFACLMSLVGITMGCQPYSMACAYRAQKPFPEMLRSDSIAVCAVWRLSRVGQLVTSQPNSQAEKALPCDVTSAACLEKVSAVAVSPIMPNSELKCG